MFSISNLSIFNQISLIFLFNIPFFFKMIIGIIFLILGFFIGNFLAKKTEEELKPGKPYFKIIIYISLIGSIISLFLRNDSLLFAFLFIIIVTSRSLFYKKHKDYKFKYY